MMLASGHQRPDQGPEGRRPHVGFSSAAPPDVSQRYVAFCDILGFSNRLQEDFYNTLLAYDEFLSFLTQDGLLNEVETCVYSDAVLITSPNLGKVVSAVRTLWFVAQQHYFLIRGGISWGRYWEKRVDGHFFVASDALAKAVRIESSVVYPMVAIDPEIEIPLHAWVDRFRIGVAAAPILNFRGHNIVNPFSVFWFRSAAGRLRFMKEAAGRVPEKYDWILDLHAAMWERDDLLIPQEAFDQLLATGVLTRGASETPEGS